MTDFYKIYSQSEPPSGLSEEHNFFRHLGKQAFVHLGARDKADFKTLQAAALRLQNLLKNAGHDQGGKN